MIQKKELIEKLSTMNLDIYEVVNDIDTINAVGLMGFDELFRFIRKHSINTVFYYYEYVSSEVLEIGEDIIEEIKNDSGIDSIIENEICKYNEEVNALDFSVPDYLLVYCIYNGVYIYANEYDFWYEEKGYGDPRSKLISIMEDHLDDIMKLQELAIGKRETGREQLRERILNDNEFHRCTNVQLRRAYAGRLFGGNSELQGLFCSKEHGLYDISIHAFIEEIWKDYKGK